MFTISGFEALGRIAAVECWAQRVRRRLEFEEIGRNSADNYTRHFLNFVRSTLENAGIEVQIVDRHPRLTYPGKTEEQAVKLADDCLSRITAETVNAYLKKRLEEHGDTVASLRTIASTLRQAFDWLTSRNVTIVDPNAILTPGSDRAARTSPAFAEVRRTAPVEQDCSAPEPKRRPKPRPAAKVRVRRAPLGDKLVAEAIDARNLLITMLLQQDAQKVTFKELRELRVQDVLNEGTLLRFNRDLQVVEVALPQPIADAAANYIAAVRKSALSRSWTSNELARFFLSGDGGSLTVDDASDAYKVPSQFYGLRDEVVTLLVGECGINFAQVVRIRYLMFDRRDGKIRDRSSEQEFALTANALRALRNYMQAVQVTDSFKFVWQDGSGDSALLLSTDGGDLTADDV